MSLIGLLFVIGMILFGLNTMKEATNETNGEGGCLGCLVAIVLFLLGAGVVSTAIGMLFH